MKERGRPKSKEEVTEQAATRIPASLKRKITEMAKREKRSFASMLRNLIEDATLNHK